VIRSSRRGGGIRRIGRWVLAAAGLAVAVTACSAGQQAQTAYVDPAIDGASGNADGIALRAVAIASPNGGRYAGGADARLQFVMVNTTDHDDALVEVRTDVAARVTFATGPAATGSAAPSGTESVSPSATPAPTTPATTTPAPTTPATTTPATTTPATTTSATTTSATTTSATTTSASPTPTPARSGSGSATASGTPTPTPSASPTPEAPSRIDVPADNLVACRDDGPVVTLVGLTRELRAAEMVPITFVFATAGEVTINVPVAVPTTEVSPPPTVDVNGTEGG
jgi:copper(I)-binding protein